MKDIKQVELTKYTKFAGCGAKLGPGTINTAMRAGKASDKSIKAAEDSMKN